MLTSLFSIIGLAMGSFLNVVISRLEIEEDGRNRLKMGKRSVCDNCKKPLKWYDLVPVFSFLILRGRCRYCDERIPMYHPLVELAAAFLAAGVYFVWGISLFSLLYFLIGMLMIGIFFYDYLNQLIPDLFIWAGFSLASLLKVYQFYLNQGDWMNILWGVLVGGGVFGLFYLISKGKWMGLGDVKLGALMGLILSWPNILVALYLAVVSGGVLGAILVLSERKGIKSQICFGPFLVVGFFIALFFGKDILRLVHDFFYLY